MTPNNFDPNDTLTYSIINPDNFEQSTSFVIKYDENANVLINGTKIDTQQLAELGALMSALAGKLDSNLDSDSIVELLNGFCLLDDHCFGLIDSSQFIWYN